MPFDEEFDDVYQIGIKESCRDAGAYSERVDEQIFNERILDRIYNQIAKADCIIADMTGRNANVFYEVGYAHALGKPTILLTRRAEDIPFDLKHFPHIVYESKLTELRDKLTKRVRWFIENPPAPVAESSDLFELSLGPKILTSEVHVIEVPEKKVITLSFVVRNISLQVIPLGALKAAFLTLGGIRLTNNDNVTSARLPNGHLRLQVAELSELFPDEVTKFALTFVPSFDGPEEELGIRIYTELGPRDFPLMLRKLSG